MKKIKKTVVLRLLQYVFQYRALMILAIVLTISSSGLALLGPTFAGRAVNAIELGAGKVDFDAVYLYSALMVVFYVISFVLSYSLSILMIHISRKIVNQMRNDVFKKLNKLPVSYFDKIQAGDLISLISYDIDTVNASLSSDVILIFTSIITVVGSLISMILISPQLVLVFLFTVPLAVYVTVKRTKVLRPMFRQRSKKLGEMNGYIEETVTGAKTIKAYNREHAMLERFDEKNLSAVGAYYDAEYKAASVGPTAGFINALSLTLVSVFGAFLFFYRMLSLGDISAFILYSRRFTGPITEFGNIVSEITSACSAADRIFMLIDSDIEVSDKEGAITLSEVKGNIEFDSVNFSYDKKVEVIRNLSFTAKQGDVIAIVGKTGAGKTTIVNLLMRFYDIDSGSISIDGVDIRNIKRDSLRKAYTMVLQDTWLFKSSIFDNIAYGKEGATLEEVIQVAKKADIHDYIMSLPQGYDSILNDDGVNISKGQKQLLTIARAMMNDSNILILDEATSNVDTRTEIQIQSAMEKLMEGRTCFVIAHRLSTIRHANTILVMEQGDVLEMGNHDELLEKEGMYASLYQSQFD